ncbi:MAG: fluoride efflux transporter CrcB [Alphaproteobacteria bacterium]
MSNIYPYLTVAIGGGLGAMARFGLSQYFMRYAHLNFPIGTLIANFIGCLGLGLLAGWLERNIINEFTRLLLMVGFMGALTTFSTFSMEFIFFAKQGEIIRGLTYVGISFIFGFALFAIGYYGAR